MGSPCEVLCETGSAAEAEDVAETVAIEAWRIEDKFSRYVAGNIVDRINSACGNSVEVDEETAGLIEFANLLYDMSDGRFDITSGVLRKVWTFDGSDRVPTEAEILDVMQHVGWEKVSWKSRVLKMPAGMQIDLGGVGKEYAVDKAIGLIREHTAVACLVNFGGDLAVTGPPTCQASWQIGREAIAGPFCLAERRDSAKDGGTRNERRHAPLLDERRHSLQPYSRSNDRLANCRCAGIHYGRRRYLRTSRRVLYTCDAAWG